MIQTHRFIHSTVGERLSHLQFLVILSRATINIHVQVFE